MFENVRKSVSLHTIAFMRRKKSWVCEFIKQRKENLCGSFIYETIMYIKRMEGTFKIFKSICCFIIKLVLKMFVFRYPQISFWVINFLILFLNVGAPTPDPRKTVVIPSRPKAYPKSPVDEGWHNWFYK